MKKREKLTAPLIAVLLGLLVGMIIVIASGKSPVLLISAIIKSFCGFDILNPGPINPRYFRNPLKAMTITAAAGPLSNLLQMIFWALLLKALAAVGFYDKFVISVCAAGISVNLMLMAFNLIPIPPLDGGRIVRGLLPRQAGMAFDKIEPYGFMILLVLMVGGGLSFFVRPFLMFGQWIINLVL